MQKIYWLLAFTLLQAPPALQAEEITELPPSIWQVLEFERKSAWGNARSRLELRDTTGAALTDTFRNPGQRQYLTPDAADPVQELLVEATVGSNNSVNLQLLMQPETLGLYQRSRFSIGRKDRRFKFFRYADDGFTRMRKDPASKAEAKLTEDQWSKSSSIELKYTDIATGSPVTSPFALFALLSRLTAAELAQQPSVLVNTDMNVYRVTLQPQPPETFKVNYQLTLADQTPRRVSESITAIPVKLLIPPTALASDKPDFEVMGLRGDITIYIDHLDHTPLRVSGTAPRVGAAHLDLAKALLQPREPAAQ